MTHYDILGVEPKATPDELRGAYRALIGGLPNDASGQEALQGAAVVYELLMDRDRREAYDLSIGPVAPSGQLPYWDLVLDRERWHLLLAAAAFGFLAPLLLTSAIVPLQEQTDVVGAISALSAIVVTLRTGFFDRVALAARDTADQAAVLLVAGAGAAATAITGLAIAIDVIAPDLCSWCSLIQ